MAIFESIYHCKYCGMQWEEETTGNAVNSCDVCGRLVKPIKMKDITDKIYDNPPTCSICECKCIPEQARMLNGYLVGGECCYEYYKNAA